jgi:DNA-binding transcriptional MerR regulator
MPGPAYTLSDLCDLAGVTPRTVRYYVAEGLIRPPGSAGPGARYDDGHLARLRLIRRLQREHLPLAEIRRRLAALDDAEAIAAAGGSSAAPPDSALDYVRDVLARRGVAGPAQAASAPTAPAPPRTPIAARTTEVPPVDRSLLVDASGPTWWSADAGRTPPPERSQWERIVLSPDIELHVRRPLTRSQNRAVARLIDEARRLLEEDQP